MGTTLWQHYINTAQRITENAYQNIHSSEDWEKHRKELYVQFMKSMRLHPLPDRENLRVIEHGDFTGEGFRAVKYAYEVLPECWCTGTAYYPDPLPPGKHPGVLYLCGHQQIGLLGYQPHALMWARRGYVCFIFDTIEQHDCNGNHHGTYYRQTYDWVSRGYSGAGGELWNSIRALDVLCSLPEVDIERVGATGISGGGAQSFYVAIADERVKALATACGVTMPNYTLAHRHVQTHCDCIYLHNFFLKSTGEYAGLIAPRPALYCFASEDSLFSPVEYKLLVEQAKKPYELLGCEENCELFDYDAPHMYTPESIERINDWFDKHVAGEKHPAGQVGEIENCDSEVTVFNGNPPPENKIYLMPELMSSRGSIPMPSDREDWPGIRDKAVDELRREVFSAIDVLEEKMDVETQGLWKNRGGPNKTMERQYNCYKGTVSGMDTWICANTWYEDTGKFVVGLSGRDETAHDTLSRIYPCTEPNGLILVEGRTAGFNGCHKAMEWDFLRAGAIIGLSPVIVMVQDLLLSLDFIFDLPYVKDHSVYLYGKGDEGVACIYAALFDKRVAGVVAEDIPISHTRGAHIPGILRVMDLDHAIGLLAPRPVGIVRQPPSRNNWSARTYQRIGCAERRIARGSLKIGMDLVLESDVE